MKTWLLLLAIGCSGQWRSQRAAHPATREELRSTRITAPPQLEALLAARGFNVVHHPAYRGDLTLELDDGVATLRSDGFFVDEVRGSPDEIAEELAASERVAEFIRNSGTVEQRSLPEQ